MTFRRQEWTPLSREGSAGSVETGETRFILLLIITGSGGNWVCPPPPPRVSFLTCNAVTSSPFLILSEQQYWQATAGGFRCNWLKPISVPFSVELSLWTLVDLNGTRWVFGPVFSLQYGFWGKKVCSPQFPRPLCVSVLLHQSLLCVKVPLNRTLAPILFLCFRFQPAWSRSLNLGQNHLFHLFKRKFWLKFLILLMDWYWGIWC